MGSLPVGAMLVLSLLAILVLVLWVLLPFAVFGIKPEVRRLRAQVDDMTRLLAKIEDHTRPRPPPSA